MRREPTIELKPSDGQGVCLETDAWGRIVLTTPNGDRLCGVDPIRAFPITDPSGWICFCDADGREVFRLRSADGLDPESRRLLDEELSRREFTPLILRIQRVTGEATPADWEVETDRGPTRFTLDSEDDIRPLGPHRLLITDSRKIRYLIPDLRALDSHSRRLLDRFQ